MADTTDTAADAIAALGHHVPFFITPPGAFDALYFNLTLFLVVVVLFLGAFYFKLHALPEHMAHDGNRGVMQLVGILALLALFTHNNAFWVAALLLAVIKIPDFLTPMREMALSMRKMAEREDEPIGGTPEDYPDIIHDDPHASDHKTPAEADTPSASETKPAET